MTKSPPRSKPLMPPALLDWAARHPAHRAAAAWLASVYGAAVLRKPDARQLAALLGDCQEHAPAELARFVLFLLRSLPSGVMARDEIRALELDQRKPTTCEGDSFPSGALMAWCRGRGSHFQAVFWLLSLYGVSTLEKPGIEALETLLIDVSTLAPSALFQLTASMIRSLPPAFLTSRERESLETAVDWLSRTVDAEVSS